MIIYRTAAACGLVLEMLHNCGVHVSGLPIGGGPLAQLGAVFGAAFVLTEGREATAQFSRWIQHKVRAWRRATKRGA